MERNRRPKESERLAYARSLPYEMSATGSSAGQTHTVQPCVCLEWIPQS